MSKQTEPHSAAQNSPTAPLPGCACAAGVAEPPIPIIDCHIHPTPAADYTGEIEHLLQHMRKHRISMAVASDLGDGWKKYPDSETVRQANRRLSRAVIQHPRELAYLVYLNPQLDDWQDEFASHRSTACGVKLWTSLRAPGGGLEGSKEVLRQAAGCGLPVLIHTFERTGGKLPGEIGIDEILELAHAVPECRIVAAHAGGNWRMTVRRKEEFPGNVVFDFSGSYPERTMVARLLDAFGPERLLYGSDAPGRSFGSQLFKAFECGMERTAQEKILWRNACRIFHLPVPTPAVPGANGPAASSPSFPPPAERRDEDHFCFIGSAPWWDHRVTPEELANEARRHGVTKLFAADLSALEASDKIRANAEWLRRASGEPRFRPLATVDLRKMDEALRQLEAMAGFAGVWLSPYLHGYKLEYAPFELFWRRCAEKEIPLWINTSLSDDRFRKPELAGRPVAAAEITDFAREAKTLRCCFQGVGQLTELSRVLPEHCFLEYSKLSDGEYAVEKLLRDGAPERLCRGSEYPFRAYGCVDAVLADEL